MLPVGHGGSRALKTPTLRTACAAPAVRVGDVAISNLSQLEVHARAKLPKQVYDYYAGGAEDERTVADNEAAFTRLRLLPRMLVDVSRLDTRLQLFGTRSRQSHARSLATVPN